MKTPLGGLGLFRERADGPLSAGWREEEEELAAARSRSLELGTWSSFLPCSIYLLFPLSLSLSVVCCRPPPALAHLHGDAPNQVRMCASTDQRRMGKANSDAAAPGPIPSWEKEEWPFFIWYFFHERNESFFLLNLKT